MKTILSSAVLRPAVLMLAVLSSATAFAGADCVAHPKSEWMPKDQLIQSLKSQGYQIKKFKVDDNCYEIYGKNKQGQKVEIYFDTKTGKAVKTEID